MTHEEMEQAVQDLQRRVQKLEYAVEVLKSDNEKLRNQVKVQQFR